MTKKFKLAMPHPETAVIVTLDDADAYLMRSERWFAKRNSRSGRIEVSRSCNGVTEMFGRRLFCVTDESICVAHKNGDETDFRRDNLILLNKSDLAKISSLASRGLHTGTCSRGHQLTSDDIDPNGGGNGKRTCRLCDILRQQKRAANNQTARVAA